MTEGHTQRVLSFIRTDNLYQWLSIGAVLFGAFVRVVQYASNRSLWSDEAMLALNIVDRSYLELLQPLDYNQAAPPLFLWLEKAAVQLLGNNEYALRLWPLTAGLIALVAFYRLALRTTAGMAAPIAIALFASLNYILYYTTEVKQYSSDVMATVLLCLLLLPLQHQQLQRWQLLGLGLGGAILIWLSHPAILVLAGIEAATLLTASRKQRWALLVNRSPLYLAWLLSFAGLYFLTIGGTLENENLVSSWDRRYPDSLLDFSWLFKAIARFFYNPLGFGEGIAQDVAILGFLLGCIAYSRRQHRQLIVLLAPIIVTIVAAYLQKYPFRDRLALFLTPLAILVIAAGLAWLLTRPQRISPESAAPSPLPAAPKQRRRYLPIVILGMLMTCVLLAPPLLRASYLIVEPAKVEELRPVLEYVNAHQQPGDQLYVYRYGRVQFQYYAPRYGYTAADYVIGKPAIATGGGRDFRLSPTGIKRFQRDVERFRGKPRVWFVFCRTSEAEEQIFLSIVEPIGEQLDQFKQHNAFVYLYSLE